MGSHGDLRRAQVLLIQEATQKDTIPVPTLLRGWTLALHKSESEWRGQKILVRPHLGTLRQLQGVPGALAAVVGEEDNHIGVVSLHLPPRATLDETEAMLSTWGAMQAMRQKKVIVGFDCNETLDFDEGQVSSRTARGEAILTWAVHFDLTLPAQQGLVPSFFPYNTAQQTRRLDYVMTNGLRAAGWRS